MHDTFSEGGVYYGRAALAVAVMIALAVLVHFI